MMGPDDENLNKKDFIQVLKHPFTSVFAGPTQSGKTTLIKKIIFYNKNLIFPNIDRIIYCYTRWQKVYEEMKNVEFNKGILDVETLDSNINNLVILDDLMTEGEQDKTILNLFTVDSHHKNTSVIYVTQNLFSQGKFSRSISLNAHYMILLNNPRDRAQISFLARQMFPTNPNYLIECYDDAVDNDNYGYLFIDFKQTTQNKYRVQSGIFPQEKRVIYIMK